jgi:PAS domain S-box-containing protein
VNMLVDISERKSAEDRIRDSEARYRRIFDTARVSLWEQDLSEVMKFLESIRAEGVTDPRTFFQTRPHQLGEAVRRVRIKDVNAFTVELFEADRKELLLHSLAGVFLPETMPVFIEELVTLWEGRRHFESECVVQTLKGQQLDVLLTIAFEGERRENTLVSVLDMSAQKAADRAAQQLAAIVESSEDAILAKDLNGIITSWNKGAERIYGYTEEETIGKPVTIIIPPERHGEEPSILARIRKGERIDHYETVRRRKDGSLIDISLTVSPIKDATGRIAGASKIARDITGRKRAQEQQYLLLREMSHRVKNLFTVAGSIVALSARDAATAEDLARSVQDRLAALAQAHELTLTRPRPEAPLQTQATTLHALISKIISPFENQRNGEAKRLCITGPDIPVGAASVTAIALLLHEFATNAAKYGALSDASGHIDIRCSEDGGLFSMIWKERGGPPITEADTEGFGGLLIRATVKYQLGGEIEHEWKPEGLAIRLSFDKARLAG